MLGNKLCRRGLALGIPLTAVVGLACSSPPAGTGGSGGEGGASGTSTSTTTSFQTSTMTLTGTGEPLPEVFEVTGIVTDGTDPLEGAIVMQAGGTPSFVTGPDGTYTIEMTTKIAGIPAVVAAKEGYRTHGEEILSLPDAEIVLPLKKVNPPDNTGYAFEPPGVGDAMLDSSTAVCGHCHTTFVKQFRSSAHEKATKDPLVQDLYAGITEAASTQSACTALGGTWKTGLVPGTASDTTMKCYLGGGVLPDLNPGCGTASLGCDHPGLAGAQKPAAFGACADCHAPGINGKAGGRNLHDATGTAFDAGNHCDVCHKARDVDLTKPAGVAGALVLQRPQEKLSDMPGAKPVQVMFGSLPDVPLDFMGGSYQPKFLTSELCAACHEMKQQALLPGSGLDPARWPDGLPVLTTYDEWESGPFNTPGTPCQFCHMPPDDTGLKSSLDVTDETNASLQFGYLRPPEQIRKHIFRSPLDGDPRFIDAALNLVLGATLDTGPGGEPIVMANVTVQNVLAGHAIPTGEPMRSLIVLVEANGCSADWAATDGPTVQDSGGARSTGTVGAEVQSGGATLTWSGSGAKIGDRIRVVRPTGQYDDYAGVGFFADPMLTAAEKGLQIYTSVGEANVVGVAGSAITLSAPIAAMAGDVVYVGDALSGPPNDGDPVRALAGAPGNVFQKTLVDPGGARNVHHHRAVDIASDNRILPASSAAQNYVFAVPPGCTTGTVRATLIYRPVPADMARLRGWDAKDWVVGSATMSISM